jgi:hypothetical protein
VLITNPSTKTHPRDRSRLLLLLLSSSPGFAKCELPVKYHYYSIKSGRQGRRKDISEHKLVISPLKKTPPALDRGKRTE